VIGKFLIFGCSLWFTYFVGNLFYVAKTRGYVMARTEPFKFAPPEVPQTRRNNPQKFWANVISGIVFLPIAIAGLFLTGSDLLVAIQQGR
jgi:hypothetical protein